MAALAILLKRLRSNGQLLGLAVLGLGLLCALVVSIPLYAEAVSTQTLRRELAAPAGDRTIPRAAILLNYAPTRSAAPLSPERYSEADRFAREQVPALTGLPLRLLTRYAQSDVLPFLAGERQEGSGGDEGEVFLTTLEDLAAHVDVLEGRLPRAGVPEEWEALIATAGLDEFGLRVGERIGVVVAQSGGPVTLPVRIVGRWEPKDSADPFWFNQISYYQHALFVPEETYFGEVLRRAPRIAREYGWYFVFDPAALRVGDVEPALAGLARLRAAADQALRGLKIDASPEEVLESLRERSFFLQILLFVLSAPLLIIVLQFVASAAGMIVERERGEIAVLRGRGATTRHIGAIYLAQWGLLALPSLAIGVPLAVGVAAMIGESRGFLTFNSVVPWGSREALPILLEPRALAYGVAAAALAVGAALVPALGAARHSVVSYKQEVARSLRPGFARRYFLDLLPLPAALYAYYLLGQRQSVLPVGEAGDVFSDPLLLLAPGMAMFAAGLLLLRLLPPFVAGIERLGGPFAGVTGVIALRQLARQPGQYQGLVLLLILTTALGAFSAATASTIDRNYGDLAAYRVGADLRLSETGVYDTETEEWTLLPLSDHLLVPGVQGAARVLRIKASEKLSGRGGEVTILGIDAADFPAVAHWRTDYAGQSIGELSDMLVWDSSAVVVDRRLLAAYGLGEGDRLTLAAKNRELELTVAGAVDYFPTLYPDDGAFVIANLDYLFDQLGAQPHDVWLRLQEGADPVAVVESLREQGVPVVRAEDLGGAVAEQRRDATRMGVLGLASVGFLIAALLTVLALIVHAYLSFRRRAQQLAILRAMGLTFGQLATLFVTEQALLLLLGIGAGTLLGRLVALLYVPFLQIKSTQHAGVPPFVVASDWGDLAGLYAVLGVFLLIALPLSVWLLHRVRIHEALRFGEEQG